MKVAIVIFVVGEKYINNFKIFEQNIKNYCKKYEYDFILLTELIFPETDNHHKKFYWQRMLIPDKFNQYDFVVSMDSDIYINPNAPPLPLNEIPIGKVAAVNERKYFGNYEWRENIQIKMGWEKTGKDWYKLSGEIKDYHDHINGGLVIYQPKYHAQIFKDLYHNNIAHFMNYHQDDQSILSSFLIDNDMIHWLDERFNRIWFFWKEILYPNFSNLSSYDKYKTIRNFIQLNYFCHFTTGSDIEYI